MARASHALASRAGERLAEASVPRVLVLAGRGDNGGDALFAGAELARAGTAVDLLLTAGDAHGAGLVAARNAGAKDVDLGPAVRTRYGVVLDGMVGLGGRGALRGGARDAAVALAPALVDSLVIAVDLPSGLDPDDGRADDAVLAATETLTFGAVKAGLARGRGPQMAGRLVLVDIGLGPGLAARTPAGEVRVAEVITAVGGQRA
jgi:hydroxyethylthiazole kinase-like uncharacterized protein yjeF